MINFFIEDFIIKCKQIFKINYKKIRINTK